MIDASVGYVRSEGYGAKNVVRAFGWSILAVLAAFLIDNILTVGFNMPGSSTAIRGATSAGAWAQLAIYVVGIALAVVYVARRPHVALRDEARAISRFNAYLIRSCFWAVLFVGVVDASIAFMRIESLLPLFFDEATVQSLGRARYVGLNVHMPLIALAFIIAAFTRTLGFTWLTLLIVLAELLIVLSRFIFSYEQAMMGDLVRYWYAALFLFASAYTLIEEGHVRVDVVYAGMTRKTKGFVNAVGSVALGVSTCWVILAIGFHGKQSIINSPVANFEVTQTGSVGMFIKYQMAIFLAIFGVTMMIQFISFLFEAVADIRDDPGHIEPTLSAL